MFEKVRPHAIEMGDSGFTETLESEIGDAGPDDRTLFIVANEWTGYENIGKGPRTGHVYTVEVKVPARDR